MYQPLRFPETGKSSLRRLVQFGEDFGGDVDGIGEIKHAAATASAAVQHEMVAFPVGHGGNGVLDVAEDFFEDLLFKSVDALLAFLQPSDMSLVHLTLFSLAVGSLLYYLCALAAGVDAFDEALEFDSWKWADESIARSGRLGVGQEVWDVAQLSPFLREYATLSGTRTVNRQGADFADLIMGPSFDAMLKAGGVFVNLDDPTQSTLHKFRQLLPFQNLFYFRRALDQLEGAAGLPERRN